MVSADGSFLLTLTAGVLGFVDKSYRAVSLWFVSRRSGDGNPERVGGEGRELCIAEGWKPRTEVGGAL